MKDSPTEIAFATCGGIRTAYRTVDEGPLLLLICGAEVHSSALPNILQWTSGNFATSSR